MKDMNLCPHCDNRLEIVKNPAGIIVITCHICSVQSDLLSNIDIRTAYSNFEEKVSLVNVFARANAWGKEFIAACDNYLPEMIASRPPNKGDRS